MRFASSLVGLSAVLILVPALAACGDGHSGDAGTADAGADSSATDAGPTDAGAMDAGSTDAGSTDAGSTDAGSTDGGATDGGSIHALCLQSCELAHSMCGNTSDCASQCAMFAPPTECVATVQTALECLLGASDLTCMGTSLNTDMCDAESLAVQSCVTMHSDGGTP